MNRKGLLWAVPPIGVTLLLALLAGGEGPTDANDRKVEELPLCALLSRLKDGQELPVQVTGIYMEGYEQAALYDPDEPTCSLDIQPSTWVEFAPGSGYDRELGPLIEKNSRALVTFRGVLQGPPAPGPDDPSVPVLVAFANRSAARRFGHLGAFRTQLKVAEVLSAREVPEEMAWQLVKFRPTSHEDLPVPTVANVPRYPPLARNIGLRIGPTITLQ